jgi:hypothetical protein
MDCATHPQGDLIRHVQYICMTSKKFAKEEDVKLKAELFQVYRGMTHWSHCNIYQVGSDVPFSSNMICSPRSALRMLLYMPSVSTSKSAVRTSPSCNVTVPVPQQQLFTRAFVRTVTRGPSRSELVATFIICEWRYCRRHMMRSAPY